ncbi:uncharacterized protein LOC110694010 [Chenopodium quinoa]|uniref:uncharacterized protein LOC110694010 n=1 Tax=Chenopodium quinoa TaxID=63459 RepID=UPI000B775391|nr:uncharacterized protein LOC110694010 [Chenopodium quinoa]
MTSPWVVRGDFNNVFNLTDRFGSPVSLTEVEPFRQCLRDTRMFDWQTGGMFYTWNNKQDGLNRVSTKIDRVLVNNDLLNCFPDMQAMFHPKGHMDQCPCVITLSEGGMQLRKPFRFFNKWVEAPGFLEVVRDAWNINVAGTVMFQVIKKLAETKKVLKSLKLTKFTCVETAYAIAERKLLEIQTTLQGDPSNNDLITQEKVVRDNFGLTHRARYYKSLLGTTAATSGQVHPAVIEEGKFMPAVQRDRMCRGFTDKDVKTTLWSIEDDKSPGPDGFSSKFFKQVNATFITLVPKVENANMVTQYRPIACCNVIYKIISKMICERLKEVLPELIDPSQGAFVAVRSILDNILLFTRVDLGSIKLHFKAFQKFSEVSSLSATLDKSDAYFGSILEHEICELQQVLGMANGTLPFRPLIERVTSRIDTWATKYLSYAGRLQLVKSVLFGVQAFWDQIFILPKKIIREMESRFRCFLWTGKGNPTKKALVAWKFMCLPKFCDGWNLNTLEEWNKATITNVLWDLASKSDNL